MAFTPEARQAAAEARARNRALRAEAVNAVLERPPDPDPDPEDEPDSGNVLAELATLFKQASGEKRGRDKAINNAIELLGTLSPAKYPEIADNPAVQAFIDKVQSSRAQSGEIRPGTLIGTGIAAFIKPWSWSDILKGKDVPLDEVEKRQATGEIIFPWVIYQPIKTTFVGWNGLHVYFRARQRVYVCKVFVDVFEESLNLEEFAEQHAAWMFNTPGIQVQRDFFSSNAPQMKAMDMGHGEYFQPGGGMIDLTPSPGLAALGGGTSE